MLRNKNISRCIKDRQRSFEPWFERIVLFRRKEEKNNNENDHEHKATNNDVTLSLFDQWNELYEQYCFLQSILVALQQDRDVDTLCLRVTRDVIRHLQTKHCAIWYYRDHMSEACELLDLLCFPIKCLKQKELFSDCVRAETMHRMVATIWDEWTHGTSNVKRSKFNRTRKSTNVQGANEFQSLYEDDEYEEDESFVIPNPPPLPMLHTENREYGIKTRLKLLSDGTVTLCTNSDSEAIDILYLANMLEEKLLTYPRNYIHNIILRRTLLKQKEKLRMEGTAKKFLSLESYEWIECMTQLLQYGDHGSEVCEWVDVRNALVIIDHYRRKFLHEISSNYLPQAVTVELIQQVSDDHFDSLFLALSYLDKVFHLKSYFSDIARDDIERFELMTFFDRSYVHEMCKQLGDEAHLSVAPFLISQALIMMCVASNSSSRSVIASSSVDFGAQQHKRKHYKKLVLLDRALSTTFNSENQKDETNEIPIDPIVRYFKWKRMWRALYNRYTKSPSNIPLDDYSCIDPTFKHQTTASLIMRKLLNEQVFKPSSNQLVDLCSLILQNEDCLSSVFAYPNLNTFKLPTLPPSDSLTDQYAKWPPDMHFIHPRARPSSMFLPDQLISNTKNKRTIDTISQAAKLANSRKDVQRLRLQLLQYLSSQYCSLVFDEKQPLYDRVLLLLDLIDLQSHSSSEEIHSFFENELLGTCLSQMVLLTQNDKTE